MKTDKKGCIFSCLQEIGTYEVTANNGNIVLKKCVKCEENYFTKSDLSGCVKNCVEEGNYHNDVDNRICV